NQRRLSLRNGFSNGSEEFRICPAIGNVRRRIAKLAKDGHARTSQPLRRADTRLRHLCPHPRGCDYDKLHSESARLSREETEGQLAERHYRGLCGRRAPPSAQGWRSGETHQPV